MRVNVLDSYFSAFHDLSTDSLWEAKRWDILAAEVAVSCEGIVEERGVPLQRQLHRHTHSNVQGVPDRGSADVRKSGASSEESIHDAEALIHQTATPLLVVTESVYLPALFCTLIGESNILVSRDEVIQDFRGPDASTSPERSIRVWLKIGVISSR